jgi:signal peptidase I
MSKNGSLIKKIWKFIWEDNSIWSWLVNVILAFVIIKFVIYPVLGLILGTSYPLVAVVSGSMEHEGKFDDFWQQQNPIYLGFNITKEDFLKYAFKNGFKKGDIMVLAGKKAKDIQVGEVIVFQSSRQYPIIHRVVKKW